MAWLVWALMVLVAGVAPVRAGCSPVFPSAGVWFRLDGNAKELIHGVTGESVQPGTAFVEGWVGSGAVALTQQGAGIRFQVPESAVNLKTFTVEGWMRRTSTVNVGWDPVGLFFAGGPGSIAFGIGADGRLVLSAAGATAVHSVGRVVDESWHHVAVVHDRQDVRFYIDGEPAGQAVDTGSYGPSAEYALGRFASPVANLIGTFAGSLDEWTFYRTALQPGSIAAIARAGRDGKCIQPVVAGIVRLPALVRTNTPFEFEVSASNFGPSPSPSLAMDIEAAPGLQMVNAGPGAGSATVTAGRIRWTIPPVPGGGRLTLVCRAESLDVAGVYRVTARVADVGGVEASSELWVVEDCAGDGWATHAWKLDGNGLESVSGNVGNVRGNATFVEGRPGRGQALEVKGGSSALLTQPGTAVGPGDFTAEVWMRRTGAPTGDGVLVGGGARSFAFGLLASGEPFLSLVGASAVNGNIRVLDFEWHHVAVTRSGGDVAFHVDGNPAGTASYPVVFQNPAVLGIGGLGAGVEGQFVGFVGLIDDVRLHSVALPPAAIRERAIGAATGECPRDVALVLGDWPRTLEPGSTGAVTCVLRNAASTAIPGARLTVSTNGFLGLKAFQVAGGEAVAEPGGFSIPLGTLAVGEVRTMSFECVGLGSGLGTLRIEVTAGDGGLTQRSDDRLDVAIGVGEWCEPPPADTDFWLRAERDFVDSVKGTTLGVEGTVPRVAGRVGQGFRTSAGSLAIVDPARFNIPAFTVQAWVYPEELDGGVDALFSHEADALQPSTVHAALGIRGTLAVAGGASVPAGRLMFMRMGGAGLPDAVGRWTDTGVQVPLKTWTHVALGFGPGVARVWVNGAMVREFTGLPQTFAYNDGAFRIGWRTPNPALASERFNGIIDEFMVTRRLLERHELGGAVAAGAAGYCDPDLALVWEPVHPTASIGEPVRVGWVVTNGTRADIPAVVFRHRLPARWTAGQLAASAGLVRVEDDVVVGEVPLIPGRGSVRFEAVLQPAGVFNGVLTASVESGASELFLGNNTASVPLVVAPLSLSVDSVSAVEGGVGASTWMSVPVRLSAPVRRVVTMDYATGPARPGSGQPAATPGIDFEPVSGVLTFQPGEIEKRVLIRVLGDDEHESAEAFGLVLSNITGGAISAALPVLAISNDDPVPLIRLGDAHVMEGDTGTSELVFPIELSGTTTIQLALAWSATNGSAAFPQDFSVASGAVVIPPGARAAEIRVPVVADTLVEGNEAMNVGIALAPESAGAAIVADGMAVGVIVNDDGLRDRVVRFEWVVPPGVKRPGEPIPVELRALDGFGQVVSNFNGSAALGAVRMGQPTDSGHPAPLVVTEIHTFRTAQVIEIWNTSGQALDISGWKAWLYENTRWPLPMEPFVFPVGTVIPANSHFILSDVPDSQGGLAFRIPSPRWGPEWNSGRPLADQCIGVLIQQASGEIVDFFGAGMADPSRILVPTAVEPGVWAGFPVPMFGLTSPGDGNQVYQRVGQSNPRNASAWQLGIGERVNRYLKPTFVDGAIGEVMPQVALGFIGGVWRGQVTIADPAQWMSLYADGGDGRVGVHAPIEFEVANDLRIESYTLGESIVGNGLLFSQQVTVTNPGPAVSTDVQIRVVLPYGLRATLDETGTLHVSQGTARLEPAVGQNPAAIVARLGQLEAGRSAALQFRLLAGDDLADRPRNLRFIAETSRLEPDPSAANNRAERTVETAAPPPAPLPGRVAWLRGEGDAADALGRLVTTNRGVSFVTRRDRRAFQFDGTGRIEIGASESLVLRAGETNGLIVSLWMRTPPSIRPQMVLFETEPDGLVPGWSLQLQDGRPVLVVGSVSRSGPTSVRDLRDGRWHLLTFQIAFTPAPRFDLEVDGAVVGAVAQGLNAGVSIGGVGRARLGGAAGGNGFVGELDEITVIRGIRRNFSAFGLFRKEYSAGARGSAEAIVEPGLTRRGPDGQLAGAVAGRPYTLTYRLGNRGWADSGPLLAGVRLAPTGSVVRVQLDGVDVPLVATNGAVFLQLAPVTAGGSSELALTFDRLAPSSITPVLILRGGLRDLAESLAQPISVRADADRDGMADDWERALGLDPANALDALLDLDGDGYSNLAEFDAGTAPGDFTAHPTIEWQELGSAAVRVRVRSRSDMDYVLEHAVDLPSAGVGWTPLQRIRGTGGVLEIEAVPPDGAGTSFYRLRPAPLW